MDPLSVSFARALPDQGVALMDPDGRIADWNAAAAAITGVSAADAVGHDLAWLSGPGVHDEDVPGLLAAARDGPVARAAWRQRADGTRFWCTATLFAVPGADGGADTLAEVFRDETAMRAVQVDVEQRRAIVAAVGVAGMTVYSQDLDLRVRFLSEVPEVLRGRLDREDILGRTEAELFPAEIASLLAGHKRRVIETGEPARFDLTVQTAGGPRVFDNSVGPLRGQDGTIVGVATTFVDVTERRESEALHREGERRLAESERIARLGSWDLDIATNEMTRSPGLLELYGLDKEEFPADGFFMDLVHPDDRERCQTAIERAVASGGGFDVEYRVVLPGGRVRTQRSRAEVLVDERGRPSRLVGTIQDTTDVRAAEDTLQRAAAARRRRRATCSASRRRSGTAARTWPTSSPGASCRSSRSSPTASATPRSRPACT